MGSTRDDNVDFSAVRELIRSRLVEQTIPSLAVAAARNGTILCEEGFGWADRENRVPASEHTMCSLASIAKPITAPGVMALNGQGKPDAALIVGGVYGIAATAN